MINQQQQQEQLRKEILQLQFEIPTLHKASPEKIKELVDTSIKTFSSSQFTTLGSFDQKRLLAFLFKIEAECYRGDALDLERLARTRMSLIMSTDSFQTLLQKNKDSFSTLSSTPPFSVWMVIDFLKSLASLIDSLLARENTLSTILQEWKTASEMITSIFGSNKEFEEISFVTSPFPSVVCLLSKAMMNQMLATVHITHGKYEDANALLQSSLSDLTKITVFIKDPLSPFSSTFSVERTPSSSSSNLLFSLKEEWRMVTKLTSLLAFEMTIDSARIFAGVYGDVSIGEHIFQKALQIAQDSVWLSSTLTLEHKLFCYLKICKNILSESSSPFLNDEDIEIRHALESPFRDGKSQSFHLFF